MATHRLTIDTGIYDAGDVTPKTRLAVHTYHPGQVGNVYAQILINGESACLDEDMTVQLIQALLGSD